MEAFYQSYVILQDVTPLRCLGLFDLPLHDSSHFTLTGSGIAEEW